MRVTDVTLNVEGFPKQIDIAPARNSPEENWITVLTGENGTRKSLLLRLIAGGALGKTQMSSRGHDMARVKIGTDFTGGAQRIIALSGTANDRFPDIAGIPVERTPTSFDVEDYFYFGPSYGNSLTTKRRLLSNLAHSLLFDPFLSFHRRQSVTAILKQMHFLPVVGMRLSAIKLRTSKNGLLEAVAENNALLLRAQADTVEGRLAARPSTRGSRLRDYAASLLDDGPLFREALRIASSVSQMHLNFGASIIERFTEESDLSSGWHIANLIALGVVRVEEIWFYGAKSSNDSTHAKKPRRFPSGDLSSGQWQLMTGLLNLSVTVQDHTLILVDEPENSLHPQWQRDYIALLRTCLGTSIACHVIIATHSPLVAAGVNGRSGNLIALKRDEMDGSISLDSADPVYAWRPDDVLKEKFDLESTRPPELIEATDRLLAIVGRTIGSDIYTHEELDLARKLAEMIENLPSEDPLLPAIRTLISIARNEEQNERIG